MEEADLLKERLQAITDKRRIRENIAIKRRQIEDEKLKLQYIKKKALREQWLMDGLSQQEEEQEAMRLQAQDEQQQSDQLQSNILRIEKEIEDLETQELDISANEEVVLKRLKEVERTPEDIIKELNAEFRTDPSHPVLSPLKRTAAVIPLTPAMTPAKREPGAEEYKKATFAMEITVERDQKTGQCQVVATANITPETFRDRGLKVYDDGRKSVYALNPHGGDPLNGTVREMTPSQVEELLDRAVDKDVPSDVHYYQPVYSVTYAGNSRPSTPRTPNKTPKPSPSPCSSLGDTSPANGTQAHLDADGWRTPILSERDAKLGTEKEPIGGRADVAGDQPLFGTKAPLGHTHHTEAEVNGPSLVSVKARTDAMPTAPQLLNAAAGDCRLSAMAVRTPEADPDAPIGDFSRRSPFSSEGTTTLNMVKTLPEERQGSEPVTMVFMGYEKAYEDDEDDFQAELVVVGDSSGEDEWEEEDEARSDASGSDAEGRLSYHPEGCTSRVFRPTVATAKISSCGRTASDAYTNCGEPALHKPTFLHKGMRHGRYLQGHGAEECADAGSINMEKMKLCSTGR